MNNPPSGMITFLFIDVKVSEQQPAAPTARGTAVSHNSAILQQAITACGGSIFKANNSVYAAFTSAPAALAAALAAYWTLHTKSWGEIEPPQVRLALHTGPAGPYSTTYVGSTFNHTISLLAAAHSGQILLSRTTRDLVVDHLPNGTELHDFGEHRLRDLTRPEHLFQLITYHRPVDLQLDTPPEPFPINLPVLPTPLIGRDREVADIRTILQRPDVRILTLLGSSGTGKTRLSLQVSVEMSSEFVDGVYFVPLAPIATPALVTSAIAQALSIKEVGDQPLIESLRAYLAERHILLILDNFEQLLASTALIEALLAAAPRLKVLVTSQIALELTNEYVFPVPPLALPDPARLPPLDQLIHFPSIALFLERAQVVLPDFTLTSANAAAVAELCVCLRGLPLAIELVAAYSDRFSPAEMNVQITRRLAAHRERAGGGLTHKQLLQEVLGWSYALLGADEQALFARLGVFEGGCSGEAAKAVCSPDGDLAIDMLGSIVLLSNKNLLVQEEWFGHEPRYLMLDMIHQFAQRQLAERGEVELLRRWHAAYNLALAEQAETQLTGSEQESWLKRLESDLHNLRAALKWSIEQGESEIAIRLSGALWRFWYIHGYLSEGRQLLTAALANSAMVPAALRTKALTGASVLSFIRGDYEQAKQFSAENLALFRTLDDKRGIANTLSNLGAMATEHSDYAEAQPLLAESLALRREIGDKWGIAAALNNLARASEGEGDYAYAEALYTESLALFQELADKSNMVNPMANLGWMTLAQSDYRRAKAFFTQSLSVSQELGHKEGIASSLQGFAQLAATDGRPIQAARLLGVVDGIYEHSDIHLSPIERARQARTIAAIRAHIDEAAFAGAWAEGQATPIENIIRTLDNSEM